MPDKQITYGSDAVDARYRGGDDDPAGGGNYVVAERLDENGDSVDVLLEWDEVAEEWVSCGPVNLNGNDVTNVGALDANSISTGDLSNASGNTVFAAIDGHIAIYSETTTLSDAIDVSATSTPIQDAWDTAPDGSTLIYPPQDIETPGELSGVGLKRHIGMGRQGTRIVDTDETTPTLVVSDTFNDSRCYIDGIQFQTQTTPRSAPGFVWNSTVRQFNIGPDCVFRQYDGADLFHFDSGHAYDSVWVGLDANGYDTCLLADNGGAPLTLVAPSFGSTDETTPEIDINTSMKFMITDGWNKGRVACPFFDGFQATSSSTVIKIGEGNFEPSVDNGAIDFVMRLHFDSPVNLSTFKAGGSATVNNGVVEVNSAQDPGRKEVEKVLTNYSTPEVAITGGLSGDGSLIYHGSSADVDNQTGALLSGTVHCQSDGVFKKSTGTGNDGGTDDTIYGP